MTTEHTEAQSPHSRKQHHIAALDKTILSQTDWEQTSASLFALCLCVLCGGLSIVCAETFPNE
jgi:hypothetical protein